MSEKRKEAFEREYRRRHGFIDDAVRSGWHYSDQQQMWNAGADWQASLGGDALSEAVQELHLLSVGLFAEGHLTVSRKIQHVANKLAAAKKGA